MKVSEMVGFGVLGLVVIGATGGTVYVLRKDAAATTAGEQARAIELERLRQQAQAAANAAAATTPASAPATRPPNPATKPAAPDLGKIVTGAKDFAMSVKGIFDTFSGLF